MNTDRDEGEGAAGNTPTDFRPWEDDWRQGETPFWANGRGYNRVGRLPTPTTAMPGTEEKIKVLAERWARGEALFHPDDARLSGVGTLQPNYSKERGV